MSKASDLKYIDLVDGFFKGIYNAYQKEVSDYIEQLSLFFKSLLLKYKIAREVKKQTDKYLASDFNVIKLFEPKENKISDILALLLDPNGEHGQGGIFLRKFLEIIEESLDKNLSSRVDTSQVILTREYSTDEGRRIDIILNFSNNFFVGIENKPWAGEQEKQLEDYIIYLEKISKGNYLFIYLDGWGRKASSISKNLKEELKRRNKFLETTYYELLLPWLKNCLKECEAEKVRWFLRDFISWIQDNFQ